MFGVLLESRARHQRRSGGVALSVAGHIAIIGAATVATVHGKPAKEPIPVEFIRFKVTPAPAPSPARHVQTSQPNMSQHSAPALPSITIAAPIDIPVGLPAIDLSRNVPAADISIGSGAAGTSTGRPGGSLDLTAESSGGNEWRGNEVLMHITSSAKPRYPDVLRQSNVDGRVLVQFVVDTLGRIDMGSVRVLNSTHDLFTQSVRNALPSFRFKPAEVGGKRTSALAEMPFEFAIAR